jgi:hypothetical protein
MELALRSRLNAIALMATSLKAQLNQRPLFAIKMFVFGIHRNTVPQG